MVKEIRLPQLGQTMEEGTIINCLVKEGDEVKKGSIIFEIETDKATLEMESPCEGFVKHIFVAADQTVPIGYPMLILGSQDEKVSESFIDSFKEITGKKKEPEITKPAGEIIEQDLKDMTENGVLSDLALPIEHEDIKLGQTIPVNKLQKITAAKMLKSKREIPCFYLTVKADITGLVELRNRLNNNSELKLSYNDFIIKAIATGLEKYPIMTGQIEGNMIKLQEQVNIGLAISVEDGLIAPVLKDVTNKDIKQISSDCKALIDKTRSNKLELTDLEGGCITISNLGAFGIDNFIPIVVPGQCSIVGIGRIIDTCIPDNGNMVVRKFMNMTLSVDHKVVNGAYAAQFLDFVHKMLEDPSSFGLEC